MNKVKVLGLSLTLVFATLLVNGTTSAYAGVTDPCQLNGLANGIIDPQLTITDGAVFENPNEVSAKITVCDPVTATGFKGTGVLTFDQNNQDTGLGTVAVTTTHGGVLDSATQNGAADSIPHNHYVDLVSVPEAGNCLVYSNQAPGGLFQVAEISWESPGVAMWVMDMYKIWEVPKTFDGSSALDLGVTPHTFTLGDLGVEPTVVSFNIALGAGGEVCILVQNGFEASLEDLMKVGGLPMVIDSNALVLAGIQSTAMWMIPVVAGAAGAGIFFIRSRMNKD